MSIKRLFPAAILLILCFGAKTAVAATCAVILEQAYQRAVENGWGFKCEGGGVLAFDKYKRLGCTAKAKIPNATIRAMLFGKHDGSDHFHNGWKLHSYKVANGQYTKTRRGATDHRVYFFFVINKMGSRSKRHVSELKLSKSGGNCNNVLSEAF